MEELVVPCTLSSPKTWSIRKREEQSFIFEDTLPKNTNIPSTFHMGIYGRVFLSNYNAARSNANWKGPLLFPLGQSRAKETLSTKRRDKMTFCPAPRIEYSPIFCICITVTETGNVAYPAFLPSPKLEWEATVFTGFPWAEATRSFSLTIGSNFQYRL